VGDKPFPAAEMSRYRFDGVVRYSYQIDIRLHNVTAKNAPWYPGFKARKGVNTPADQLYQIDTLCCQQGPVQMKRHISVSQKYYSNHGIKIAI
jgi:hypothetical protein